jgi:hypothetical protein
MIVLFRDSLIDLLRLKSLRVLLFVKLFPSTACNLLSFLEFNRLCIYFFLDRLILEFEPVH